MRSSSSNNAFLDGRKTSEAFKAAVYDNGFIIVYFNPSKHQAEGAIHAYEASPQQWASMNCGRVSAGRMLQRIIKTGQGHQERLAEAVPKTVSTTAFPLTQEQMALCRAINEMTGLL